MPAAKPATSGKPSFAVTHQQAYAESAYSEPYAKCVMRVVPKISPNDRPSSA